MFASIRSYFVRNEEKPPLLLFDYDGVIADSFEVYFSEFTKACTLFGYDHLNSEEAFMKLFDGNLVAQLIKSGFPLRKLKALVAEFAPQIEAANARIRPFPGMPETLGALSAAHPVVIITANTSEVVRGFLARHGLHQVHDVIGSDVETSKVKKIRKARRMFPRCRAYYIGDTKGDMIEARRARAVPVGVGWGWHDAERLRAGRAAHLVMCQTELRRLFGVATEE